MYHTTQDSMPPSMGRPDLIPLWAHKCCCPPYEETHGQAGNVLAKPFINPLTKTFSRVYTAALNELQCGAYDPRRTWSVGIRRGLWLNLTWADLRGKQRLIHSHIPSQALTNDQSRAKIAKLVDTKFNILQHVNASTQIVYTLKNKGCSIAH